MTRSDVAQTPRSAPARTGPSAPRDTRFIGDVSADTRYRTASRALRAKTSWTRSSVRFPTRAFVRRWNARIATASTPAAWSASTPTSCCSVMGEKGTSRRCSRRGWCASDGRSTWRRRRGSPRRVRGGRGEDGVQGFYVTPRRVLPGRRAIDIRQSGHQRKGHPAPTAPSTFEAAETTSGQRSRAASVARRICSNTNVGDRQQDDRAGQLLQEGAKFKWHQGRRDPAHARHDTRASIVSSTRRTRRRIFDRTGSRRTSTPTRIQNSGDVLLFGGPSRMIVHSVTGVVPRTMPPMLRKDVTRPERHEDRGTIEPTSDDVLTFPATGSAHMQSEDSC